VLRFRLFIFFLLLNGATIGSLLRAQLSEEEKKKREAFLKAREEMRTVATPTPSASPKPKPKPKAAKHPPKKKSAKPKETPEPEETPKKAKAKLKETPEPEETAKPKAKKSATPKPKEKPKKEEEEEEEEKKETPRPKAKASATPAERESAIPRGSAVPTPSPEQPAEVLVQKSGFQEADVLPEPSPEERRFLFWKWSKSAARYRYLSRSVRAEIDRARVLRRRWQFIVVHNSGTRQGNARIFDYYHRRVRRMTNGLAYHFVIGNGTSSDNGEIEVGNRWRRQINGGHVHSDYLNNIALGICLVGDFNRDQPTRAQLEACEELIRYLRQRCGKIDAHYAIVKPHREMNPPRWPTDCPGDEFPYSWFRRFLE
jgi:outer membrane biosynthesis protein TonB